MVIQTALRRLGRDGFANLPIGQAFEQVCQANKLAWRDRLLPPLLTLKLFILQVLHGNTSIAHLRQLSGIDFAPSSYCEARQRLPLEILTGLLSALTQWAQRAAESARGVTHRLSQRIFIIDGSNFSMSDNDQLRREEF